MTYPRFTALLRAVFSRINHSSVPPVMVPKLTTESLRRLLPTLGEALGFGPCELDWIGAWKDRVGARHMRFKLPRHIRYGADALNTCSSSKRTLLRALGHGARLTLLPWPAAFEPV